MNRRIVSAVVAFLGLVVIVLAVCSATVWRPSATATASLAQEPDQPYVLVEPGVLRLLGSDVTVSATAEGHNVLIAVANSADARAWLADDPYVSVTGLSDWNVLSSESVTERCPAEDTTTAATATPSPETTATPTPTAEASAEATASAASCTPLKPSGANPAGSILWQSAVAGRDTASLDLDATDPDLVVLVANDGTVPAPTLTLSWLRPVSTPFFVPGLILGGLLILAGVGGFLFDLQVRRADEERRRRAAERAARLAAADSVETVTMPRIGAPDRPLTRREMRDKERAEAAGEEWIDPRTGAVYLDGGAAAPMPPAPMPPADIATHDAGAPRGSAVLPGLDSEATAAHRSARELEDDTAFAVAEPEASEPTDRHDEEDN